MSWHLFAKVSAELHPRLYKLIKYLKYASTNVTCILSYFVMRALDEEEEEEELHTSR